MTVTDIAPFALDEAKMLADLAQLTPEPTALPALLSTLGYITRLTGTGLFADGAPELPVLLFPLYHQASLAIRKRQLIGQHITKSGALVAGMTALQNLERRPSLLFVYERQSLPLSVEAKEVVSLEGGVVPRVWRRCYGSFDALVRVFGQSSHPGLPNTAVNAIESGVPVLQALLHLKIDIARERMQRGHEQDAPLQPRLSVSAVHGGSRGSVLPTVLDILVNRRYAPDEKPTDALDEILAAASSAAPSYVRLEIAMTQHETPLPDPDEAQRTRIERALAAGWGWPQVPFCADSTIVPGATILGGLERPDRDGEGESGSTTLDEMTALARTVRAFLLDKS